MSVANGGCRRKEFAWIDRIDRMGRMGKCFFGGSEMGGEKDLGEEKDLKLGKRI